MEEGGANGHNSTPQPAAVEAEADEADPGVGEHQTASDSVQGSAGAAPAPSAAPSGEGAPYRAALWAKQTLPGHDLTANASWNAASLDSSASYCQVPLTLALDLSSKDRPDGIQYRVGLHQVGWLSICRKGWNTRPGFVVARAGAGGSCRFVGLHPVGDGAGRRVLTARQCRGCTGLDSQRQGAPPDSSGFSNSSASC